MTRELDYLTLGEAFEERGQYLKAERFYKKALTLKAKQVIDPMSAELVPYLYNLGMVQAALDKTADACRNLGRLSAILLKEYGPEHEDIKEIRDLISNLKAPSQDLAVNA